MRILVVLNGSDLKRWNPALPEKLRAVARDRGVPLRIELSKTPKHMDEIVAAAIRAESVDVVMSCGGDGTLHYLVNHPLAPRVAIGMLPAGTINAFLRAEGANVLRPIRTFEQLLAGRIVEGHVGRLNGRRFACFASWGYDARVVHRNPSDLKRRLRAASYVVTGVRQLAGWRDAATPGRIRFDTNGRRPKAASSVVISKIRNYAGFTTFSPSVREPALEALYSAKDAPGDLLALYSSIAARGLSNRVLSRVAATQFVPAFERAEWLSQRPVDVQMDGEAVVVEGAHRIVVDIDPQPQRYLLP